MRAQRIELTVAGECIANFRVAKAKRIISCGSDESTKFGDSLLSTNTQIVPHDAPGTSVDVLQRSCTLTNGGNAEAIAKSIDEKLMQHGKLQLQGWKEVHERIHGVGSWAAAAAPDPDSLGMHRLAENTVIQGDTCSTAEKTKRLIVEAAESAARERGVDKKAFIGHCH